MAVPFYGPLETWQDKLNAIVRAAILTGGAEKLRERAETQGEIDLLRRPSVKLRHGEF